MSNKMINGYVDLLFEPVKEVFDNNFKQFDELGSAFSVKHNGQTVVDLKAGPIAIESEVDWSDQTNLCSLGLNMPIMCNFFS